LTPKVCYNCQRSVNFSLFFDIFLFTAIEPDFPNFQEFPHKDAAMTVIDQLKEKLTRELSADHVEIIDDSWRHAGHAGTRPDVEATHLTITVVSPQFEGIQLMDQHRLVHAVLKDARDKHLHALQLKTIPTSRWTP
jgi:BolA protein